LAAPAAILNQCHALAVDGGRKSLRPYNLCSELRLSFVDENLIVTAALSQSGDRRAILSSMKHLRMKPYIDQKDAWPDRGQVILAQYDDEAVVVYQAYGPGIARWAVDHQRLGGAGFSFERMSWIKTSYFWMMHRSQWGTDKGQERILAIWVARAAFDGILTQVVQSRFESALHPDRAAWEAAVEASDVRVQWDPDYPAKGPKLERRAIQIGLRGAVLRQFAEEWIVQVEDISEFVREQAKFQDTPDLLFCPAERLYPVKDQSVARRLGLDKAV